MARLAGCVQTLFLALFFTTVTACLPPFRDSPYSRDLKTNIRNLNLYEKARVEASLSTDNFKFAAIADTHQNYSDLKAVVNIINSRTDIDFIAGLGDYTNYGYNFEYDWFLEIIINFQQPFLAVIGNHDAISKGKELFLKTLGPYNWTVQFANSKLIFWNSNTLEFHPEKPDFTWLQNELVASAGLTNTVLLTHVPPYQPKYFSTAEQNNILSWLASNNIDLFLNGHNNGWKTRTVGGNLFHQVNRVEGKRYSTVEFNGGSLTIEQCTGLTCQIVYP